MRLAEETTLPGTPGPRLQAAYDALSDVGRGALRAHLLGRTSAEWLAKTLTAEGYPISASSIRTYRRSLSQQEV